MMKNKKQNHILTAIVSAVLVFCGCSAPAEPTTAVITNPVDIKYQTADMSGYEYLSEPIAEFREITLEESIRFFKEGGSGDKYTGAWTPLKITVGDPGPSPVTTTTQAQPTTTTTTATTPVGNADFNFSIVDENGQSAATVQPGQKVLVDVLVDAGNNTCAGSK